jgi:cysteine desulfurase
MAARACLESARAQVAGLIRAPAAAIVFTSGATESNNLAILGAARANGDRGRHLISVRTEHRAVLDPLAQLVREGFKVTLLDTDRLGRIDAQQVLAAVQNDTILVSIMAVNNETGVLQDIRSVATAISGRGILLHVDAAQAAGRISLDVAQMGVDLMSLSAHKIHGPPGVGALYVRREPRPTLRPLLFGGGQEFGVRPGTLPVHQIVGMGCAFQIAADEGAVEMRKLSALRDRLWQELQVIPRIHLNGHPTERAPHILNVSFEGIDGESLQLAVSPLAVASGSACSAASGEPSYVLRALGRQDALAAASLRFSLGRMTSEHDIQVAAQCVITAVLRLRELAPQ